MPKKGGDWYPDGRQDQLNYVKRVVSVLTEDSKVLTGKLKWQEWGIPEPAFTALAEAYGDASAAFEAVLLSGTRGGPLGAAATEKLRLMETLARDFRRRFIFSPPISAEDMAALNEKEKDGTRTPGEAPRRGVAVKVSYEEEHAVTLNLLPGSGDQDVSGFTFSIRVGVLPPDGKVPERSPNAPLYITKKPAIPEDLPGQYNRSRRHETFRFTALEAGMTAYFAIAYINSKGETGPWTMISAIIT